MPEDTLTIGDAQVPRFLYGTAWKKERTQHLVELAVQQGFRGIDTANQRRHYDEAAVGRAISACIASGLVTREDLFLQSAMPKCCAHFVQIQGGDLTTPEYG